MPHAALKVKIGIRPDGNADHPNFNYLPCVKASGMDWSKYVDVHGCGWWYDTKCGHDDDESDSPRGMQWGVLCVTEEFVDQAVEQFPELCSEIGHAECEAFHDERHMHRQGAERRDVIELQALEAEAALMATLTRSSIGASVALSPAMEKRLADLHARIQAALDPADDAPGVRRNQHFSDKVLTPLRKA